MTSTILVRHLAGSSLAGQSRAFRQPRVRLGRRPENDVVFDPTVDRTVSGHHCDILADAGGLLFVVDDGSTNGTFVNGHRVRGRVAVTPRDQIMLGDGGPVVAVSAAAADAAGTGPGNAAAGPNTIVGSVGGGRLGSAGDDARIGLPGFGPDLPGTDAGISAALDGPETHYSLDPFAPVGAAPMAAAQMAAGPIADVPPLRPVPTVPPIEPPVPAPPLGRAPSRASQGVKASIGMNTLMVELDKATRRERKRVFVLAVPVVAALVAAGAGLAIYLARPAAAPAVAAGPASPPPPPTTTVAPAGPQGWAAVLGPRKSAVYLIVKQRPGKEDRGLGTAWSAARGLLATNAHVAEEFENLDQGEALVARSNTNPPTDLRITAVALHPGYTEFERLHRAHFPVDAETGKPLSYPTPYDAALLSVAEPDVAAQRPPLAVADAAALAGLVETAELAYVGFPMEASVERGVNVRAPVAHQFVGYLSRKTDIFLSGTSEERANFLQYTLVVQGGASGSPVFARDGTVVGLISGNDHVFGGAGGRIAITGKSFGPRADAVRDLLDKSAAAKVAPYAAEWRAHFRALFDRARAAGKYDDVRTARTFASFEALSAVRSAAAPAGAKFEPKEASNVRRFTFELDGPGPANAKTATTPPLAAAGVYCVVVSTDDPDLLPQVALPEVEQAFGPLPPRAVKAFRAKLGEGSPYVASYPVAKAAGETLQFVVSGVASGPDGTPAKARMTAVLVRALE